MIRVDDNTAIEEGKVQTGIKINGKYFTAETLRALVDELEGRSQSSIKSSLTVSEGLVPERPNCLIEYFERWQHTRDAPPMASAATVAWSILGSFIGMLVLSALHYRLVVPRSAYVFIVGSFGAQSVLLFAAPTAPLSQPWNCVVGNLVSAFGGVAAWQAIGEGAGLPCLASAVAVPFAIVLMHATNSLHPPGGATALIAVLDPKIHEVGFMYILFPAVLASIVHVLVALLWNNISSDVRRNYPATWKPFS
eukprot:CAMPEP_0170198548 /NCGR_PEP_ID=MMETSP0040_2-20121228/68838_1 /TAXON_ID=641309 /ORGANISM="Lotharella oceanica, Strain CCMP622" /LENGTH=250 /DNA_ID=CAMNT_0010448555 /DNA_START=102 /DNA_END=854 /DNA_ORIENTATION=-